MMGGVRRVVVVGQPHEVADVQKPVAADHPACRCACWGYITFAAGLSCIFVLCFRMMVLTQPVLRWVVESLMTVFFVVLAYVTWPPQPDPCCYASCTDWCCGDGCCPCAVEGGCHPCALPYAYVGLGPCIRLCASPDRCTSCRGRTSYNSILSVALALLSFVDMLSRAWSCWGDIWSSADYSDCQWTDAAYTVVLVVEFFYGPLLFIFILWNIAGFADRGLEQSFALTGPFEVAHRARAAQLYTDALAWWPLLVVQIVLVGGLGSLLIWVNLVTIGGEEIEWNAMLLMLTGGVPVVAMVCLLAWTGDCRVAALWAGASARCVAGPTASEYATGAAEAPVDGGQPI